MLEYYSQVTETEDIVNETSMKVFSMSYLDDSEDDMTLPYDVNSFLLGAVASVSLANNKLDVNRYESSDLEVVTLRQLKHALSGKVKDITYENNVLRVVTFERSDLFGLQTKAAIVSLLTNVVSDVRVVGNELVVERWSAADVANGITRMEFEPHISVSATKPYLLSGEATDLVVSLVDGFGSPVDGELVTVSDGTSVYNGITNNQGVYTLSDVRVSQNTTFTATYSNVSDSVTIYYSKFADLTGDTSKYSYDSRCNVTSSNNEITVTWVSGTYILWANADGSTEFDYTGDFTVEFDLLSNGNNATIQIYDNSASTYYSKTLDQLNGMNAGHYKIVKDGQVFRTYVDGVEKTNQQVNSNITGACRVGFRQGSASTIQFRNFVIY